MKILKLFCFTVLATLMSIPHSALAETVEAENPYSVFETVYNLELPEIKLPKVMEVSIPYFQEDSVAIIEKESKEPVYTLKSTEYSSDINVEVTETSPIVGQASALFDGRFEESLEFNLDEDNAYAYFVFDSGREITLSGITLNLDKNVALPYQAQVQVQQGGKWKTLSAKSAIDTYSLRFPPTEGQKWKVELWHPQPLLIKEITLTREDSAYSISQTYVRFLGKPDTQYLLYADAKTYVHIPIPEIPNLYPDEDILQAELGSKNENPDFIEVYVANEDQEESRFTEQLPWIPWLAVIGALIVVAIVGFQTYKSK